jgi:hypothetical protein
MYGRYLGEPVMIVGMDSLSVAAPMVEIEYITADSSVQVGTRKMVPLRDVSYGLPRPAANE